tara:strand:+ start:461 stop:832 length:372 start_codon:yes stop_codon:yes gene_type:complete
MVKQLVSKDIKHYLTTGPKKILLDVRTQEEWDSVGKPDGNKIGLETYFLEIKRDSFFNFVDQFKNFNISQDHEILVICKSGERSQISAELISRENYKAINISDGFEGSVEGDGWIKSGLPIKI